MSARCTFEAWVRSQDAVAFADIVFGGPGFEEPLPDERYPDAVFYSDPDADYGHGEALAKAAAAGLVFIAVTGEGYDYGPASSCAIDGVLYTAETLFGGELAVAVGIDGEILKADLDAVLAFIAAVGRVGEILGGES